MTTTSILIAPPEERVLHLTIKGVTGLILHNFGKKARDQIEHAQSDAAKKPRGARDPETEYEASYYRLKNGSADLRYRPEITNWSTTLRISYDKALTSPEQIASLFLRAGYSVGVGDWRPEKDGDFGRFTVAEGAVADVGHELEEAA